MPMSPYIRRLREKLGTALLELPSVTVAVRDDQDRVLLVRDFQGGRWVMPGGAIDPEERPADAAVREVWEETGLVVELTRIVGVFGGPECTVLYENGDRTSYLIVAFEGRIQSGTLRPDGDEVCDARFVTRAEAADLDLARWAPPVLDAIFSGTPAGVFRAASWRPPPSASSGD